MNGTEQDLDAWVTKEAGKAPMPAPVRLPGHYHWLSVAELGQELPPIPWVCQSLRIAPGGVTMFSGYGYSGKTAFAQLLGLSILFGQNMMGLYAVKNGSVGHADYEQGTRVSLGRYQRGALAMGHSLSTLPEDALRLCPLPDVYLDAKRAYEALMRLCEGCVLVIVDSFRAAVPGMDENDSKCRVFIDLLSRVSEKTGCAIVLIHHNNKDQPGAVRRKSQKARGSGAIYDACQVHWNFEAPDGKPIEVSLEKDRLCGTKEFRFGIRFADVMDGKGLTVTHLDESQLGQVNSVEKTIDRITRDIVEVIKARPKLGANEVCGLVKGNKSTKLFVIRSLLDTRRICNVGTEARPEFVVG